MQSDVLWQPRRSPGRILRMAISVVWLLGGWPGGFLQRVEALPSYMDAFNARYSTTGTRLNNACTICHILPTGGTRTSYGEDFFDQPNHGSNIALALQNIEDLDSDGSGVKNLAEIDARSFPGSSSDEPPLASAGANRTVDENRPVTLNGTASIDRDLTGPRDVSFRWSQIDGPSVTLQGELTDQPTFTAPAVGSSGATLTFQLRVEDNETSFATDTVEITVRNIPNNLPPTVNAGDNATVLLFVPVKLVGRVRDDGFPDPPGSVMTTWNKVSGPGAVRFADATAVTTTARFDAPGRYVLRLTASDGSQTASDTVKVTVTAPQPFIVALPDVNGNGAADIAVLVPGATTGLNTVHVRDGKTGASIQRFFMLRRHTPIALAVSPDRDGNGVPDNARLAVLGIDAAGVMRVRIRRADTGEKINTIPFGRFIPVGLAVLPSLNTNQTAEVAVLRRLLNTTQNIVSLKDSVTEKRLERTFFLPGFHSLALAVLPAIDSDDDGPDDGPGLAVLGAESSTGQVKVQIRQVLTGNIVKTITLPSFTPQALAVVPDVNANGVDEVAVLESDAASAKNYVYMTDGQTGRLLQRLTFLPDFTPVALQVVPDIRGAAGNTPALVVLGIESGTAQSRVQVREALTGTVVQQTSLGTTYTPLALAVMEDTSGNDIAELAILRQHTSDDTLQVRIIDARTGAGVKTIAIP